MAFSQVIAVQDRPQGESFTSGAVNLPANRTRGSFRFDVTPFAGKAFPFNDPAQQIDFFIEGNFGGTWQPMSGGAINGSPTGKWGKNQDNPVISVILQPGSPRPSQVRGGYTVTVGPITFGISVEIA